MGLFSCAKMGYTKAPSVCTHNSTRVDEGGNYRRILLATELNCTHRSGEGGRVSYVTPDLSYEGGSRKSRAKTMDGMGKNKIKS